MKSTLLYSNPLLRNLTLLIILLIISLQGIAQITITNNDMPSPGDTIRKSVSVITPGLDYISSGANYTWDFAALQPITQTVDTFVTVNSVPFLYQLIFIPNVVANLAQKFTGLEAFPQIPVTDPYQFYRKTTSNYNDVGYAVTVSGIPVPIRLNPADVVYKLPLVFNNKDSSNASGQLGVPGLGFISIQRKRVNHVDGWGTLTTPYGTFNVLRLKSAVTETDSIFIDSIGFGQQIQRNYIEYKWLTNGKKQPLMQVTEEGPLVQVNYIDNIFDPGVGIAEIGIPKIAVTVSPNPVDDYAMIAFELEQAAGTRLSVVNLDGKEIMEIFHGDLPAGQHFHLLDITRKQFPRGPYLLMLETNGNQSTQKFIVQ